MNLQTQITNTLLTAPWNLLTQITTLATLPCTLQLTIDYADETDRLLTGMLVPEPPLLTDVEVGATTKLSHLEDQLLRFIKEFGICDIAEVMENFQTTYQPRYVRDTLYLLASEGYLQRLAFGPVKYALANTPVKLSDLPSALRNYEIYQAHLAGVSKTALMQKYALARSTLSDIIKDWPQQMLMLQEAGVILPTITVQGA